MTALARRLRTGGLAPRRVRLTLPRLLLYLLMVAFAVYYLLPVYVLLATGFKSFADVSIAHMWEPPTSLYPSSFLAAWAKLRGSFSNSMSMVIPAAVISAFVGSLNGYIFSKWKFRGSDLLFTLFLFGMFIPYQSTLIPLVNVMQRLLMVGNSLLGWLPEPLVGVWPGYGRLSGLSLVHIIYGIPICTLIFRNYYASIPTDLLESAKIDGAGFLKIYRYILLPLSAPGFVVVLIWQFTSIWNEFLFGLTITSNPIIRPMTVALYNLQGSQITEWNTLMAGAFLTALPTLVVYILLGRYFMRGLLAGSLKG